MKFDTIAAIASPLGEGGIGIIRVSGDSAIAIVDRVVRLKRGMTLHRIKDRRLTYGHVVDPSSQHVVDEVLIGVMRAPRTYTREDVVEINCHGGIVPLRRVLTLVLAEGARIAEPGEFTKRAFLNGRLDLAQAEAVIDLIRAQTDIGADLALNQLGGKLSARIQELRQRLLGILAQIEASIDFPEEVGDLPEAEAERQLQEIAARLGKLRSQADQGKLYRQGLKTVIIGRPNVGKSSLLNALLGEERAIVTAVPGTTRDILEEVINIRGIPLKLLDTAGLRATTDEVEAIGVQRTRQSMIAAELILWVLDGSEELRHEDKEIAELLAGRTTVVVVNKSDQPQRLDLKRVQEWAGQAPMVVLSARERAGVEKLEEAIFELVMGGQAVSRDQTMITKARHEEAVTRAQRHVQEALATLAAGMPADCLAIDLKAAWEILGEITGETVGTDLLDEIFSNFCVGK
ncbi:MAG: tRNA uridine-5-carboxymethylaminomethyl(34) synthesis GTPase MnmE [Bacillota bacterium]